MWKYKGEELGVDGIIGIPAVDMTDEEFAQAEAKQALKFPDQPGSLSKCGLWIHEEDEKPKVVHHRGSPVVPVVKEEAASVVEAPKDKEEEENNG